LARVFALLFLQNRDKERYKVEAVARLDFCPIYTYNIHISAKYLSFLYIMEIYMVLTYNRNAPKKPTNLTINSDLLSKAKELKINISSVLEHALAEKVKQTKQNEWLLENSESIASYNQNIEAFGLFSDNARTF
jgi:antitoxin CcdA